jgi:uncharacterized membrane protein YeaQ/YmgE (transglycosylase-associated protein family)
MMPLIGEIWLSPEHMLAWLVVGALAGWVAARIIGTGSGLLDDLVLGLVGAFVGGAVIGLLSTTTAWFIGSIVASGIVAIVALAVSRMLRGGIPADTLLKA